MNKNVFDLKFVSFFFFLASLLRNRSRTLEQGKLVFA